MWFVMIKFLAMPAFSGSCMSMAERNLLPRKETSFHPNFKYPIAATYFESVT